MSGLTLAVLKFAGGALLGLIIGAALAGAGALR